MCKQLLGYVVAIVLLLPFSVFADTFEANANYTVCFTPDESCTQEIINAVNSAVDSVWVQAYSFTSRPISRALTMAKERGVHVAIIFDKGMLEDNNKGMLWYFARAGIPMWIDNQPSIAHNKVMIIDQTRVITGSFNFTYAAQENNAENVLIITDSELANKYLKNWQHRQSLSEPFVLSSEIPTRTNWFTNAWDWFTQWLKSIFLRSEPA